MAIIHVHFLGICTHVKDKQKTGVPHRVVLVNAQFGKQIGVHTIEAHLAQVAIDARDIVLPITLGGSVVWRPHGATLEILEGQGGDPTYAASFATCTPSLKALTKDPDLGLSPLVEQYDASFASLYFDVRHGEFSGGSNGHGAAIAMLRVETNGDTVPLQITPFGKEPSILELRDQATIVVSNVGECEHDHNRQDFLLHYLVTSPIEFNGPPPHSTCGKSPAHRLWPRSAATVGPGCSDATYP